MKTQISYVGHAIACLFTFFKRLARNRVPYVVLALVPLCYAADWQPYQPTLLEKAKAAGQPVLMDFTAEWCAPCKEMDKKVFPDLRLVEALKSFALLRVDMTDTDSPTVEALARKFNVESLPTIIFYDATGKQTVHKTGFQEVEKMVQYAQTTLQTASPLASNSLSKPVVDNRKAHFSVTAAPTEVRRGESITLTFTATIEKDWHLYALKWTDKKEAPQPTRLEFPELGGLKLQGNPTQSAYQTTYDPNFKMDVRLFEGTAQFTQKLQVPADHTLGTVRVTISVKYQTCDPHNCVGGKQDLVADLILVEGAPRPEYVHQEPVVIEEKFTPPDPLQDSGLVGFLVLAVGAGFLSLLTPCVFPMVPITVSFFIKQNPHTARPVRLAVAYCAGIVCTFTVLGLLLSAVLGSQGANALAASPLVNLLMAILFVVFALSLFGLFEIQAPAALTNFLNRKSGETSGSVGAVLMGMTFTLAAFTCTVPFAGTVLAGAARGEWFRPAIGMLAYSTAFASPFFLLALFPRWLANLPKSGSWLNAVKVSMGFLELAAALKFVSNSDLIWNWNLFTARSVLAGWTVILGFLGLYLLGAFRFPHDSKTRQIGTLRKIISLATLAGALYLATGLFGRPLHPILEAYLPIRSADHLEWEHEIEKAKIESRRSGKPIFVDFTGYTCTNCRFMEAHVFTQPDIEDSLKTKFVRLRLYTDDDKLGDDLQRYQQKLVGINALPYYVVMTADEKILSAEGGTMSAERFRSLLEKGLAAAKKQK